MANPSHVWQGDFPEAVAAFERARAEFVRGKRLWNLAAAAVFVLAVAGSCLVGEVSLEKLADGLPGMLSYVREILPAIRAGHVLADMGEWYWAMPKWLGMLWDTTVIAFLGTLLGGGLALVLCFFASANLTPGRVHYFVSRRIMEVARAVPDLVFALIFVYAFGLGPFPGVMALAVHSAGSLCKLFAEASENVDMKPVESLRAAGASWAQTMRYGVLPQVLPNFLSHGLLRFEINVRAASVVGFVGAGGIGQELMFVVRQFVYTDISALVLLIILTVFLIDTACERIRHSVITGETGRLGGLLRSAWGQSALGAGLVLFTLWCLRAGGFFDLDMIWRGLGKLGWLLALMFPPAAHGLLPEMLKGLEETLAMAFLGTLLASLAALPLGFLGAKGVTNIGLLRFGLRRVFDVLRGVDPLIWALMVINVVGLGPFAGIMAIAISDCGVLAKIFAEAIENVDKRPIEAVRACGGSALEVIRFGYLPQVLPVLVSTCLYYFESNTRSATILGVVGAGGIGLQLTDRIRINAWDEVCLIVILILVAVYLIDWMSARIRRVIIGEKPSS
jgi:phosphonate transport system permease protein